MRVRCAQAHHALEQVIALGNPLVLGGVALLSSVLDSEIENRVDFVQEAHGLDPRAAKPRDRKVSARRERHEQHGGRNLRHRADAVAGHRGAIERRGQAALGKHLPVEHVAQEAHVGRHRRQAIAVCRRGVYRRQSAQIEAAEQRGRLIDAGAEDLLEEGAKGTAEAPQLAREQEQLGRVVEMTARREQLDLHAHDDPVKILEALVDPAALEHRVGRVRIRPADHVLAQIAGERLRERREATQEIAVGDDEIDRQRESQIGLREDQPLADRRSHVDGPRFPALVQQHRGRNGQHDAVDRPPRTMALQQVQQGAPAADMGAAGRQCQRAVHVDDDTAVEVVPGDAAGGGIGIGNRLVQRRVNRIGDQRRLSRTRRTDQQVPRHAISKIDAAHGFAEPVQRVLERRMEIADEQRQQ